MSVPQREYLRIPRGATFPTLLVPTDFQDYSHAYFIGAKELWEKTKDQYIGVPIPDNLVYPILFLVHHFLELELKSAIELTNSIGNMTGKITEEPDRRQGHDLNYLLSILQANLAKLNEIPEWSPTETTRELIEDIAKFGVFGEALRYPIRDIGKKKLEDAIGQRWPDGLIADVAAVINAAEKARLDFGGLISYLMEYEHHEQDMRREYERDMHSEYEQDMRSGYE